MGRKMKCICFLIAVMAILAGCTVQTMEEMYRLPRRSEEYNDLQKAIDSAMSGLEYSAPLSGENQQTVQIADIDGDGQDEYLLFAKGNHEKPLRILVFRDVGDTFVNTDTIECNGSFFDQVEYVNMDGRDGVEIVVGRQLNDQVMRSVSIYSVVDGEVTQHVSVNYSKFLTADLDGDGLSELFLLRPGQTENDNGVAELYSMKSGTMERYKEVNLSQPVDKLKRIIVGKMDGGKTGVYVASAVGDTALMTDIYTVIDQELVNVTLSNESGTGVRTMRNFYIYADDIDNDGVVELPSLITMQPMSGTIGGDAHHLIRWYAMSPTGAEIDKMYTYHNFVDEWYLQLDSQLAPRLVAVNRGYQTELYLWDKAYKHTEKILTVFTFSGQNKNEQGLSENRFVLHRTDSVVYAALLEDAAAKYGLTRESVVYSFRMIQQDWKTGET